MICRIFTPIKFELATFGRHKLYSPCSGSLNVTVLHLAFMNIGWLRSGYGPELPVRTRVRDIVACHKLVLT